MSALQSTSTMGDDKAKVQFVDNAGRRKWDIEKYEQQAKDREAGLLDDAKPKKYAIVPANQRGLVKARDADIDLAQKLGKTQVISANTPLSQQGGFYCDVCDCLVKDSSNYLDHINGKKHQRAMGLSMRTERATISDVRERLAAGKKRDITTSENLEERVSASKEQEEKDKLERKEKKKEIKRIKREEEEKKKQENTNGGEEEDFMAQMGFSGFGTSKK